MREEITIVAPFAREPLRERPTDPPAAARDHRDPARELSHGPTL